MILSTFTLGIVTAAAMAATGGTPAPANQAKIYLADQPTATTVTVNPGDTLSSIANNYQTTYSRIFDANNSIQDPNLIYPGDSLRIPTADEQLPDRPLPQAIVSATVPTDTSAPVAQSNPVAAPTVTSPVVQSAPISGCGDNSYANYIYSHESGCRTTAMSPNGCYGIGQACPASKIAYCGADYGCQNAFFTAYAGKYGGWAGAYAFWVSHGWW